MFFAERYKGCRTVRGRLPLYIKYNHPRAHFYDEGFICDLDVFFLYIIIIYLTTNLMANHKYIRSLLSV